jgi:predicted membrane GTPase involved in stress response
LEVTPLAYRIRKQLLSATERGKLNKAAKKAAVEAAS